MLLWAQLKAVDEDDGARVQAELVEVEVEVEVPVLYRAFRKVHALSPCLVPSVALVLLILLLTIPTLTPRTLTQEAYRQDLLRIPIVSNRDPPQQKVR
jgi:hypothetical protein